MLPNDLTGSARQYASRLGSALHRMFRGAPSVASGPGKGLRFDAGRDTRHFVSGEYERPIQDVVAGLVREGDVCYDIGANLGFFSVLLGRLAGPKGTVYAFEPVPKNAATIERNARLNRFDNVKVMRIALSRLDGRSELLLAAHVGGAVLKSAGTPPDLKGSLMVDTARLDSLVERRRLLPPNVVKIDVEGAELDVLHGMEQVLRRWFPKIILELDDETQAGCERKADACNEFLRRLGYRIEALPNAYPDGRWFVRHFLAVSATPRN